MKLLIVNQRMDENDAVLGIYVDWVNEFARQIDDVYVLTQFLGSARMLDNVHVVSLGKENEKVSRTKLLCSYYRELSRLVPKVDAVFVHMTPILVPLAAPIFWWNRKPAFLFFAHKHVDWQLRLASMIAKGVFASVPGSISLSGEKIHLVGQGIPVERFKYKPGDRGLPKKLRLVTIGRLTPRKDCISIIRACDRLKERGVNFVLRIIGPALTKEESDYEREMRGEIVKLKLDREVVMIGPVPNKDIVKEYHSADVLVNAASKTGADKVVFEAAATGCIPVACDPALSSFVDDSRLSFAPGNHNELAGKLFYLSKLSQAERNQVRSELRKRFEREHTSNAQVKRIISWIEKSVRKA